jgi:hypothetical protein
MGTKNNNFNRTAIFIALSFAVGFGVATGAYFSIFYDDYVSVPEKYPGEDPTVKCANDPRCIEPKTDFTNTTIASKIGFEKVKFLEELVNDPIIQNALKISNEKDSKMKEDIRNQIYNMRETEWTRSLQPTPFMNSIINNDVADFLRDSLVIRSVEVGDVVYGEHILTNLYGPNVAVSIRTDNYLQSNDEWWQKAKNEEDKSPFARECEFDSSAEMFSEDLVVKIFDENEQLIGIMNSATPCDVTQAFLDADKSIVPVPKEEWSEIGAHKIEYLQELMKDSTIQEALRLSNQEFSSITNEELSKIKQDTEWPRPGDEPTAFQLSIIENDVADIMRENLVVESEDFGELLFPEMILTNARGVNIASTERTFNYIQNEDEWWIVASQNPVLVRQCGWDKSIQMTSEDIIIQIFDDDGEFVGILNSASTCDVISSKSALFYGDSN